MKQLATWQETTAAIAQAVREARRAEARALATALRLEWPEQYEGWLWSSWFSESPAESLLFAQRAAQLAPGDVTLDLLRWAKARSTGANEAPPPIERLLAATATEENAASPAVEPPPSLPEPVIERTEASTLSPTWLVPPHLLAASLVILLLLGGLWWGSQALFEPTPASPGPARSNRAITLRQEAAQLWTAGARQTALARWEEAHRLQPGNLDIAESLARAHVALSTEALNRADAEAAWRHLEAAFGLLPDEVAVRNEYQALLAYRTGRDAVAARNWPLALEALGPLYQLDPGYLNVHDLIETALAGQQQVETEQRARRDQTLSESRMAEPGQLVRALLTPQEISNLPGQTTMPALGPLADPSSKHIVVSINAQRMYVYENNQLIWNWPASTGEAARPTIPGRYRIQSKFENARSNVWSLWMPYWQGIYWAGSVENGIHGQVTFDAGGRLWEGYLGTRITFGCVMISDQHAAMLFNWTELGTPVSIHWDWDPTWLPDANGDPS